MPPSTPVTVSEALALALQHHQAGRLAEAEGLRQRILDVQPGHAEALHHLGNAALQASAKSTGQPAIGIKRSPVIDGRWNWMSAALRSPSLTRQFSG